MGVADLLVAIVGAGRMGRGIAGVMALAGVSVLLYDAHDAAATAARDELEAAWRNAVAKGRMTAEQAAERRARLTLVTGLSDLQTAAVVIEAIAEDLATKQTLFSALEEVVDTRCVLATNTSSLPVTAIAGACQAPDRVVGLHFFNPVHAMKLVEVIDGLRSDRAIGDAMISLITRSGTHRCESRTRRGFW